VLLADLTLSFEAVVAGVGNIYVSISALGLSAILQASPVALVTI
jgi:hypothetical protein